MKYFLVTLTIFLSMAASTGKAHADLDYFLSDLNNQARADRNDYGVRLSAQFGVPLPQVHSMMRSVQYPADAFMCLQLGQMLHMPPDKVLQTYNANRGKGWGVIAKDLGIKPGSPEFHALKRGDFAFTGKHGSGFAVEGYGDGPGQGQGQGNDKVKEKGGPDKEQGKGKGKGPK